MYMVGKPWLKAFLEFQGCKRAYEGLFAVNLLDKVEVYEDKRIHIRFRFVMNRIFNIMLCKAR